MNELLCDRTISSGGVGKEKGTCKGNEGREGKG